MTHDIKQELETYKTHPELLYTNRFFRRHTLARGLKSP